MFLSVQFTRFVLIHKQFTLVDICGSDLCEVLSPSYIRNGFDETALWFPICKQFCHDACNILFTLQFQVFVKSSVLFVRSTDINKHDQRSVANLFLLKTHSSRFRCTLFKSQIYILAARNCVAQWLFCVAWHLTKQIFHDKCL